MNDTEFLVLPLLELTKYHSYQVDKSYIYGNIKSSSIISASLKGEAGYLRTPYQALIKLSQDSKINLSS